MEVAIFICQSSASLLHKQHSHGDMYIFMVFYTISCNLFCLFNFFPPLMVNVCLFVCAGVGLLCVCHFQFEGGQATTDSANRKRPLFLFLSLSLSLFPPVFLFFF